jgi:glucose-6-phosphate 1-dehydrogenase
VLHGYLRASGDLTKRKLIPALCNLAENNLLSRQFAMIGFAYAQMTTEEFRKQLTEDIKQFATSPVDPAVWEWLVQRIYYIQGDFADAGAFAKLKAQMDQCEKSHGTHGNKFFYWPWRPSFSPSS